VSTVCPDVNTEKTKYKFIPCNKTAGQNHNAKTVNRSFESVAKFEYLEQQ